MTIRVERYDGEAERRGLTAMIVNRQVLARVSAAWSGDGLFASKMANSFGWECVNYFKRFDDAPKTNIVRLFESWATKQHDEGTIQLAERLLSGLSGEYEQLDKDTNVEYELDNLAKHFDKVAKKNLLVKLQGHYDTGNWDKFEEAHRGFKKVEISSSAGSSLDDQSLWDSAMTDEDSESIVKYPGDVGKFYDGKMARERLIAFQAPEKRGKSIHLVDVAWRGMNQRNRVAFFEAGDMSLKQIMRRIAARSAKRPVKAKEIKIPKGLRIKEDENCDTWAEVTDFEVIKYENRLNAYEAYQSYRKQLAQLARSKGNLFWLSCHNNSTLSAAKISSILEERAATTGWIPDVIVIDYADIMTATTKYKEYREQVGQVWRDLRTLSLEWHCLVVTATQASALAYKMKGNDTMGMHHFSEDKRKNAQVDGLVGINQTPREKRQGICRLNWIAWRDDDFDPKRSCHCAGNMAIGNPHIVTSWPERNAENEPKEA